MTGYTKLFSSIVASTIWREPHEVRIVWITMLAMANKQGVVDAAVPGLADMARVSIESCETALARLESPDPHSRTPDNEGRRIKKVPGGWLILNHAKYRERMGADERREYNRVKQAESRAKKAKPTESSQLSVSKCQQMSALSAHTDTETATEPEANKVASPPAEASPAAGSEVGMIKVTSDHATVIAKWMEYYEKRTALKYPFGPRDAKAVKTLLAHFKTVAAVGDFIQRCHKRSKEGFPFGATETLYDIANGIARLQAALSQPPKPNGRQVAPRGVELTDSELPPIER